MSKLLDDSLKFLSSASPEQLDANWKSLESYADTGPIAKEFIEHCTEL